jgi:hypothetical protein
MRLRDLVGAGAPAAREGASLAGGAARKRGSAVLVAISVLAILTILVMGLAASLQVAMGTSSRLESRQHVGRLARLGFDAAMARLAGLAQGGAEQSAWAEGSGQVQEGAAKGVFAFSLKPTQPDSVFGGKNAPVYGGNYLEHRPGDCLLTVQASAERGGRTLGMERIYLVNGSPTHPRRLLLEETLPPGN